MVIKMTMVTTHELALHLHEAHNGVDYRGIAYDLGNGIEVHRLPYSLDVDRFHKDVSSGAVGDLYYLYKAPDSLTQESLRSSSELICIAGEDTPQKQKWREENRTLHDLLAKIDSVTPFEQSGFEESMRDILPSGFVWYESSWGVGFVGLNGLATCRLEGETRVFPNGVGYNITIDRTTSREAAESNYIGANFHTDSAPQIGIISNGSNAVGVYVESNPPGCNSRQLRVETAWSYQEAGKAKRVFLDLAFVQQRFGEPKP